MNRKNVMNIIFNSVFYLLFCYFTTGQQALTYNDLAFKEELGKGEFQVLRVEFRTAGKTFKGFTEAAAKCILGKDRLVEEVTIMKNLQHPNIVQFLDFVEGPDPPPGNPHPYYLVMEKGECSLYKYLKPDQELERPLQNRWAMQATDAIRYLHENKVVHRDIKPENSMIFPDQVLKVCDFGISRVAKSTSRSMYTSKQRGTYMYIAPEVEERKSFSRASDIWALGYLLWHIYASCREDDLPYPPIMEDPFPEAIRELVLDCLKKTPLQRPKIDDVYKAVSKFSNVWLP